MRTRGISRRALGLGIVTVVLATLAAVVSRSGAGADKIEFPAKYKDGILYTVADRYDVKQYRELYASASGVKAAREGKPLPSGTVLTLIQYKAQVDAQGNPLKDANGRFLKGDLIAYTVMEKRTGWGTEYPDDIRNGEWEYAAFGADGKLNDKANYKACFQCHNPHDQIDFVISYPAMAGRTMVASAAPAPAASIGVYIGAFSFGPPCITILPGMSCTSCNTGGSPHQITVGGPPLKTGFLLNGGNAAPTFKDEGLF